MTKTLLFFLLFLAACGTRQEQARSSKHASNKPEANMPNIASSPTQASLHTYYYEMKDDEVSALSEKVRAARLGDALGRVLDLMGKPDAGPYTLGDKMSEPKELKKVIDYYVKVWEKGLNNQWFDRYVSFYFDSDDRLIFIGSNVEGIISRRALTFQ